MDVRKILIGTALAAGITLSGSGSAAGEIPDCVLYDDFADRNVFDGVPVKWVMSACCPGQYPPAEGGGVEVRPPGPLSAILRTERILTGDVSVRIRGSFNGTLRVPNPSGVLPYLGVGMHGGTVGDFVVAYSGEVYCDGTIKIVKYSQKGWPEKRGRLDLDLGDGDFYIELSRRGSDLELRVWLPDEEEPEEPDRWRPEVPQLAWADGEYTEGRAGFSGWFGAGNPIIVRSIWIAIEDCPTPPPAPGPFIRGDSNGDGAVDISDAVKILNWLFLGGAKPGCKAAANVNGDDAANVEDKVDISDPVYLLNFLFLGTPAPRPPYPYCGPGDLPADKTLGCETPPASCK